MPKFSRAYGAIYTYILRRRQENFGVLRLLDTVFPLENEQKGSENTKIFWPPKAAGPQNNPNPGSESSRFLTKWGVKLLGIPLIKPVFCENGDVCERSPNQEEDFMDMLIQGIVTLIYSV